MKSRHGLPLLCLRLQDPPVVNNGKIVRAEAAQGKTNQGTLCLKGYYGWDFINDTQILTPRLKTL
ncbi:hypothetical protein EIN43_15570 [Enterobacter hormaechei]|uniref:4Fe-4S Mo/W bis-MGD-type domain-containing protein n=1 Tax=Enterobacter hormaechei TaxID=158836 RepID=A0A4Y5ZV40_9ENTR|nr:hypothetical protein EIN43_15570 [Enterobacter hormaechei]